MCLATIMFTNDNHDDLPAADGWRKALLPYTGAKSEEIFSCPATGKPYVYNPSLYIPLATNLRSIREPSRVVLFYEEFGNHDGKISIAFVDGHVKSYPVDGCKTIEELAEHHKLLLAPEGK